MLLKLVSHCVRESRPGRRAAASAEREGWEDRGVPPKAIIFGGREKMARSASWPGQVKEPLWRTLRVARLFDQKGSRGDWMNASHPSCSSQSRRTLRPAKADRPTASARGPSVVNQKFVRPDFCLVMPDLFRH